MFKTNFTQTQRLPSRPMYSVMKIKEFYVSPGSRMQKSIGHRNNANALITTWYSVIHIPQRHIYTISSKMVGGSSG